MILLERTTGEGLRTSTITSLILRVPSWEAESGAKQRSSIGNACRLFSIVWFLVQSIALNSFYSTDHAGQVGWESVGSHQLARSKSGAKDLDLAR